MKTNTEPALPVRGRDHQMTWTEGVDLSSRSTEELVRALVEEGRTLVREELRTAKQELTAHAKTAKNLGMVIALGAACLALAAGLATVGLVLLLALALPAWAATLIVAGALLVVGLAMVGGGKLRLRKVTLKPEQTLRELKEDGRWMREALQVARAKRHSEG